jgi:hypothetical protein
MLLAQSTPENLSGRLQREPAVALAALVAVLNLSVLAGRLGGRMPCRGDVLAWRAPMAAMNGPDAETKTTDKRPSNPTRSYNAGRLALNTGIAVVALAAWLHVMRINGARGR